MKVQEKKAVNPVYENILDSSNFLHSYTYKDENLENLILHKSPSNREILIYNSNGKLRRLFFNDEFKLSCAEYWTISSKVSESHLDRIIYYFYGDENSKTERGKKQFSIHSEEYDVLQKKLIQSFYDDKNRIIEKNDFSLINFDYEIIHGFDGKYVDPKVTKRINSSFSYSYDIKGQITTEEEIQSVYKNENSTRILRIIRRRNVYEYVQYDCPPVTSFYEDDVLRIKTIYSSEKDYVQYVYFDDDNYVKVEYKNGKKKSEIFYSGGRAY